MCTILVALAVWPSSPLLIAANRDERLDRPAEPPRLRVAGDMAARALLAPRDLVAGGTWLGLSDRELVVAITNRRAGPADARLRSRGELVAGALGADDRAGARAWIEGLEVRDYNPFHLLLADRHGAELLWSEGRVLHRVALAPGVHWVTERSFGAGPSQRHERLAERARSLAQADEPTLDQWRAILADHWPHAAPGERPPASHVGFDSMCVHADPVNYGTRSSTLIRLGAEPESLEFRHAPARPCEAEFVDHSDDARRLVGLH